MRRLSFFALGAAALCAAVAFSPGPEVLLALAIVPIIVLAVTTDAVPWLKLTFLNSTVADLLTGHGHVHSRADGLGAGGRHGPPRSIIFALILAVWALIWATSRRVGHLWTSAGHRLANVNASAQPLPS